MTLPFRKLKVNGPWMRVSFSPIANIQPGSACPRFVPLLAMAFFAAGSCHEYSRSRHGEHRDEQAVTGSARISYRHPRFCCRSHATPCLPASAAQPISEGETDVKATIFAILLTASGAALAQGAKPAGAPNAEGSAAATAATSPPSTAGARQQRPDRSQDGTGSAVGARQPRPGRSQDGTRSTAGVTPLRSFPKEYCEQFPSMCT